MKYRYLNICCLGLGLALSLVGTGPVLAQDAGPPPVEAAPPPVDPGPRCGGVLCDLGMFSGRRDPGFGPEPTCSFFSRVTGNCVEVAAQPAPPPPPPEPEPVKPKHKKHKHVAKAAEAPPAPAQ